MSPAARGIPALMHQTEEHPWVPDARGTVGELEALRAALIEYIDHDLDGVHLDRGQDMPGLYESCEHLHLRLGALAYPDKAAEYAALQEPPAPRQDPQ